MKTAEELKRKPEYYRTSDPQTIAETLVRLAHAPQEVAEELENAVYYLRATAENSYNSDYHRIFYNILSEIAERSTAQ